MSDKRCGKTDLHGAFILSSIGAARLDKIDTSIALQMPGVYRIILAGDIPGVNTFTAPPLSDEVLFCNDQVDYAGQPIGLVLADSLEQAKEAAKAVKVTYKEKKTPILNVFDAIKGNLGF
jgi:xanthine dehydrogenase molybdopterin-binding subunit B